MHTIYVNQLEIHMGKAGEIVKHGGASRHPSSRRGQCRT
jgi:hypothetical protein